MSFDELVTDMETALLPPLRLHETELRASGRFTSVEVFSIRHADVIHALGISCRPKWACGELEQLGFFANLTAMSGLHGRIDIQWSQMFSTRTGTGYRKKEARGFHSKLQTEELRSRFVLRWGRCCELFLRVARRGRPSARLIRSWRGAPRDLHGWKDAEENQTPDRTRFARLEIPASPPASSVSVDICQKMRTYNALSVVAPAGDKIRSGTKRLEVRKWKPDVLPLRDLLIIQNRERLSSAKRPEDPEGRAVALVDVVAARDWKADDVDAAGVGWWEPGWTAWVLENVRPFDCAGALPARLRIYSVQIPEED